MATHAGGCLCGAIRYHLTGTPIATSLCHCRSCRRAAGAHVVAWIVMRKAEVAFEGTPAAYRSSPDVTRTFCGRCGTPLTYNRDVDRDTVDIQTATLDEPDAFPPVKEIWLEHKVGWAARDERLPGYPQTSRAKTAS